LMSRVCNAFTYSGNPKGAVLGSFATNGGVDFQGNGNAKKLQWLGFNQTDCPKNPPSPPSGTPSCTHTSNKLCAETIANLNPAPPAPKSYPASWPVTLPSLPTPKSGTWNAPTDFPSRCIDLGSSGTISFTTSGHLPGIYCVSGSGTTLSLSAG